MSRDERPTVSVTSAGRSRADDIRLRQRRYFLTQGVRVVCVLLAVLVPVSPFWKVVFILGAVVLPWVGVVAANAGPSLERRPAQAAVPLPAATTPVPTPVPTPIAPARVIDYEP